MRAAHALNGPTFAHEILTTTELVAALPRAGLELTDRERSALSQIPLRALAAFQRYLEGRSPHQLCPMHKQFPRGGAS
jgi:hypothetical protein